MYEIKENRRVLPDGTEITTYSRDIVSANILEVEAGTTGYKGGDSGHGGRTYFRIADAASTDIQVHPIGRYADEGFEVILGGDCELETMIRALMHYSIQHIYRMHETALSCVAAIMRVNERE